jgi:hypothetical protein
VIDGFYLGVPVTIIGGWTDGWCVVDWPNGKTYRQWCPQIMREPWGDVPAVGEGEAQDG